MSLYKTHENKAFLNYLPQKNDIKDGVAVKYMSFAKLVDDTVRYDFYYNCSKVMTYFNLTPIAAASKLFEKYVPRFHENRYDLVQIFNETFDLDKKFGVEINKEYHEFEDVEIEEILLANRNGTKGGDAGANKFAWKTAGSICSFIFVGIMKYVMNLEIVKNLLNKDEEDLKELKKSMKGKVDGGIAKFLFNDDGD